ncbi:hypothetical protein MUK42_35641 [Musa troglodytarum]|uniref:Uncharacterized protein n=1 Tax=Musa troglodytarum TaxID=320322 RepID=A0A9E7FPZ5_9LILI|nr:hypothetical protein MUK42_35641 [Musa troglodytarum]
MADHYIVAMEEEADCSEPDKHDKEIGERLEDGCSCKTTLLEEELQRDDSFIQAMDEKADSIDRSKC